MRTRNKGLKKSIVSALGLCPKQNRRSNIRVNWRKIKKSKYDKQECRNEKNLESLQSADDSHLTDTPNRKNKLIGRKSVQIRVSLNSIKKKAIKECLDQKLRKPSKFENDHSNTEVKCIILTENSSNCKVKQIKNISPVNKCDKSFLSKRLIKEKDRSAIEIDVEDNKLTPDDSTNSYKSLPDKQCTSDLNNGKSPDAVFSIQNEINIDSSISVPPKRRRGRPPLSSYATKANGINAEPEKLSLVSNNSNNLKINSGCCEPLQTSDNQKTQTDYVPPISCTDVSVLLHFGATDNVLKEILEEVNLFSNVKLPIKRTKKGRQKSVNILPPKLDDEKYEFSFDSSILSNVFNAINHEKINEQLSTKDLFLAMNGLLRPGICEVWRRRREDRSKQLNRNQMGRLRPNPRPRKYSDMISPQISIQSPNHNYIASDGLYNEKLRHQTPRANAVSAARLTAAKKLIRAKSHHVAQSNQIGSLRSQNCFIDEFDNQQMSSIHLTPKTRSAHRSNHITSRNSRHPDVSHHIDWKFCYSTTNKQNFTDLINNSPRRRRQIRSEIEQSSPSESAASSPNKFDHSGTLDHLMDNQIPNDQVVSESETLTQSAPSDSLLHSRAGNLFGDGVRKKKRHGIAFQRKRPNENFSQKDRSAHFSEKSYYPQDDDSSASSSSKSGIVDAYGRSFRQARWYHHKPSKLSRLNDSQSVNNTLYDDTSSISSQKERINIPRPGIPSRRSDAEIRHCYYRASRRPDRMLQLTLLDRLVLGLNCSVSRNKEEIHVKHLHADELNILTQRISRTGYCIQALALRQNANNDAEYNIVLSSIPENETSMKRNRNMTRQKLDLNDQLLEHRSFSTHERNNWKKFRASNRSKRISCSATKRLASRDLSRNIEKSPQHSLPNSITSGYQSDSGLLISTIDLYSGLRLVHSDDEETRPQHFTKLMLDRKSGLFGNRHSRVTSNALLTDYDNISVTDHNSHGRSYGWSKLESNRSRTQFDQGLSSINTVNKRNFSTRYTKIDESQALNSEDDTPAQFTNQSYNNNLYQIASKRQPNLLLVGNSNPPFRRHSPRKVIRKVYTGSLTIPKILNRKRPSVANTSSMASSSSVTSNIYSSSSLTTTTTSTNSVSCMASSNNSICLNTSTASAVLFHDNQSMPVYTPSTSKLRCVQTTVGPLSFLQQPMVTLEHNVSVATPNSHTESSSTTVVSNSSGTVSSNQVKAEQNSDMSADCVSIDAVIKESGGKNNPPPLEPDSALIGNSSNLSNSITEEDSSSDVDILKINFSESDVAHNHQPTISHTNSGSCSNKESNVTTVSPVSHSVDTNTMYLPSRDSPATSVDDIHTPATSLSASQLLKLKRLHDDSSHTLPNRKNSKSQLRSNQTGSIQSNSCSQTTTQQPLESDPECSKPSIHPTQFPKSASILSNPEIDSDIRTHSTFLNKDFQNKIFNLETDDDDDAEDFELKPLSKTYDANNTSSTSNNFVDSTIQSFSNISKNALELNSKTFASVPVISSLETSNSIVGTNYSNLNKSRINLPVGRAPFGQTVPSNLRLSTQYANVIPSLTRSISDPESARVFIPNPNFGTRFPNSDSSTEPVLLSGKPVVSSQSIGSSNILPSNSVGPNVITLSSMSNSSVCPGPLKRTVVHKYHSFRKILPKSPDRSILFPTAPTLNVNPFGGNAINFSKIPIIPNIGGLYKAASFASCDTSGEEAYFINLPPSNFADSNSAVAIRRSLATSMALTGSNSSVLGQTPASQLLKSLLERGDSRESGNLSTVATTTSNLIQCSSFNPSMSTGSSLKNQPAHQSRGTWQLSKRTVTSTAHRAVSGDNKSITTANSSQSNIVNVPDHRRSPPIIPPTLRLIPGSTSRLQQLQQHYQRQQEAQIRFEKDSPGKIGLADSI